MNAHRMIAAARAITNTTQGQLAEQLTAHSGEVWTRANVAAIENGRRTFGVSDLALFAEVQDQPISWYLGSDLPSRGLGGYPRGQTLAA